MTVVVILFLSMSLSLSSLDKLFGKRLLQAGRYIMSHKSWMKTVPTENCDILMTFSGVSLFFVYLHVCMAIQDFEKQKYAEVIFHVGLCGLTL